MPDRARLKQEYKNTPKTAGVYRILNTVNGKSFLAGTLNLHGVLERDRFVLGMGSHMCRPLQEEYRAHGAVSFVFEILETLPEETDATVNRSEDLAILEQIWLDKLLPYGDNGYHIEGKSIRRV
jgi:hypothetical protein